MELARIPWCRDLTNVALPRPREPTGFGLSLVSMPSKGTPFFGTINFGYGSGGLLHQAPSFSYGVADA